MLEPDTIMQPFDYDLAASSYDQFRRGRGPYFSKLLELSRIAPGNRFLELGAGTGNNTLAMEEECGAVQIVALDASLGMLNKAKAKLHRSDCLQGDARHLPFKNAAFDFLYSTYLVHHIKEIEVFFREGYRVLAQNGILATVSTPEEFIKKHPMNTYFPSFARIDLARFQSIDLLVQAMKSVGFSDVTHCILADAPCPVDAEYVHRVENRFISTYDLIPPEEFQSGVARLKEDVRVHGKLPVELIREAVVVYGRKNC